MRGAAYLVGVLADPRRRARDPGRRRGEPHRRPDLADRARLRVVDGDDASVGEELRIGECLLGRAHRLHGDADLRRRGEPLVGREPRERRRELWVVVVEDDELFRGRRDPTGIVAWRACLVRDAQHVALGDPEHERRVRHPVVHPPSVRAAEQPLGRARIHDPRVVEAACPAAPRAATHPSCRPGLPGSSDVSTRWPQPVVDRAWSAAPMPALARKQAPRLGNAEYEKYGPSRSVPSQQPSGGSRSGYSATASRHAQHGAADPAALLPLHARAGGDQRVVPGPRRASRVPRP